MFENLCLGAYGVLGRVLQCEGQFEEAITACTRAIELGDEHAPVYLARAISYASTDQPTLAVSDCEAVLALEPNNPLAIQLHGRLLLQNGDLDAAMDAFHRARELAPDWAEPREQLSLVHLLKENPKASVDEQTLSASQSRHRITLIALLPSLSCKNLPELRTTTIEQLSSNPKMKGSIFFGASSE